jgi:hypothetical protein
MNFKNAVWLFGSFVAAGLAQDKAPVVKEASIELEVGRKAPEFSLLTSLAMSRRARL